MKKNISKIHYKKYLNPIETFGVMLLFPVSCIYGFISSVRNFLYKINLIKKYKANAFCISIGNLTTGGVGKTPIVKAFYEYFENDKSKKMAILSRGYGGRLNSKNVNVISDGKNIFYSAEDAGDEPFWLAGNCKNAAVLTCANRSKIAKYAVDVLKCNLLILDDGYQHQKLKRDLNILVVDYEKQFGNHLLLPAGPLREGIKNISRADRIIVVNKTQNTIEAQSYVEKLKKKYKKEVFLANIEFDKIYSLTSKVEVKKPKKLFAFCAIGQPLQFFSQIKENDLDLLGQKAFDDHHSYTIEDLNELCEAADNLHCDQLITTEKDAVKLEKFASANRVIDKEILVVKLKTDLDLEVLINGAK